MNDEPTTEKIVSSAIFFQGEYYLGKRHHNCIKTIVEETGVKRVPASAPQGFWTDRNRFVGREEGARLALANGQIKKLKFSRTQLFSEDLW